MRTVQVTRVQNGYIIRTPPGLDHEEDECVVIEHCDDTAAKDVGMQVIAMLGERVGG